jgi:hypothetical protein
VQSHSWNHSHFRILAATGVAAANVAGSTFDSFQGQVGPRDKPKKGAPLRTRPPGIQPVFDPGQKRKIRDRFSQLRLIMIDEYEMLVFCLA